MNEIVSLTNVTKLFQHEESLIVFWSLGMSILFYIYRYQFSKERRAEQDGVAGVLPYAKLVFG